MKLNSELIQAFLSRQRDELKEKKKKAKRRKLKSQSEESEGEISLILNKKTKNVETKKKLRPKSILKKPENFSETQYKEM